MSLNYVELPFDYFPNFNKGRPLFGGKIYVGEVGTDPSVEINQKQIYIQEAYVSGTTPIPVSQPLTISSGGVPQYNGSPVIVTVDGDYSILVLDKDDSQEYYYPSVRSGVPINGDSLGDFTSYNFNDVESAINGTTIGGEVIDYDIGSIVRTSTYYDGIQGGGSWYRVVAASTGVVDNGLYHNTYNNLQLELIHGGTVTTKQFGAKCQAGVDDYTAIRACIDSRLNVVISKGDDPSEISGWLPVWSNQIITCDGWLKIVDGVDDYEAVFTMSFNLNGEQTIGSHIVNPLIDCNFHPAANGIILRDGAENNQVTGGHIINCAHEKPSEGGYGGGRCLNIEAGSSGLSIPSNNKISGVLVENAYTAISVAGNADSPEKNNSISDITAYNCESLITLTGNGDGFPHSGNTAGVQISNTTGFNVGKSITYNRAHGIINGDRGSNALITGVKVYNEPAYLNEGLGVGSITMGVWSNVTITDADISSDVVDIVNLNTYAEVDSLPVYRMGSIGLRFDIIHRGTATNTVTFAYTYDPAVEGVPVIVGGEVIYIQSNGKDNIFKLDSELVSSDDPLTAIMATYPTMTLEVYEAENNAFWIGFFNQLVNQKFSGFANSRVFGAPIIVSDALADRSGGITLESYAPVIRYKDLTVSGYIWETYTDNNIYTMSISTDSGVSYTDYYEYTSNYFKPSNTNSNDLGESGVSSWRNIYTQNAVTVTSDSRLKPTQESIDQQLLDFAMSVEIKKYTLVDEENGQHHYGLIVDESLINQLSNIVDIDKIAAFLHTEFTNSDGEPITINRGGVVLGDVWQVRYDEWQNILLEAMRRKINNLG